MARYLIAAIILILAGLIYWLSAGSEPFTLESQGLAEEATFTWLQKQDNPVALPLAQVKQSSSIFYSENHRFYGKVSHDRSQIRVEWFTASGQIIGKFSEKWTFDYPLPRYFLTPDAERLISVDMTKHVRIFDKSGKRINDFMISEKTIYDPEDVLIVQYCPDIQTLFCGEMESPQNENTALASILKKLTLNGDIQWSRTYPDWRLNTISMSQDGNFAVASLYKTKPEANWFSFKSVFLNSDGLQIGELPVQYSSAVIDSSGRFAVLLDRQRAYLFNIPQNALVSELTTGKENRLFHAAAFIDNNQIVLQEGDLIQSDQRWVYQNISLQTVSTVGRKLETKIIPGVIVYDPVLIFNSATHTLLFGHSGGWQKYIINF